MTLFGALFFLIKDPNLIKQCTLQLHVLCMVSNAATSIAVLVSRPVTFVTGNAKKLEEVKEILGQFHPFSVPQAWVLLLQDTCLCFNALQGLPGPCMYVLFHSC
ncbi:inosine triphosphate pyrophosphatase-like isoform X2 [Durio zibethinus]|uniref:Inosine triphosphate pyrophosphatase-like isoform X2 n=1 Tax=Durio zibethinus TaxID=66656 RepID=A0A6P5Y3I6_DURZI|nr:inosine triphosphate pyrophosphatase-like isoform X2 [Durio zibethinus]